MYLQHFGLEHPPFTRQPSPDVFFAQAGRKSILKSLRNDLQQGNAAMALIGQEGAGKTIVCRLIRHRLDGSSCRVVYVENPVGSFDELLRQICQKLGVPPVEDAEQDAASILQRIVQGQREQGRRVLLLIDEAEKMFLAALERLFRLLNELNAEYGMQTLLSGQPGLNSSIEQLSGYCEGVQIASNYELEPLSVEETASYLSYRLKVAGGERETTDPIFTTEAVQEIFRLGKGIPGAMDGIAEAALENAAAAGADSVLPVHVVRPEEPLSPALEFDEDEGRGGRKGLLILLVLALLLFLFFGRTSFFSKQKETPKEAVEESLDVVPESTEISLGGTGNDEGNLPFVQEDETDASAAQSSEPLPDKEKPALFALPVPGRPDFKKKDDAEQTGEQSEESVKGSVAPDESSAGADDVTQALDLQKAGGEIPVQVSVSEEKEEENDTVGFDTVLGTLVEEEETQPSFQEEEEGPVVENAEEIPEDPLPVLSFEPPKQIVQAAEETQDLESDEPEADEAETEPLTTAKKLPVIKPTWIIELTPRMKKTRPQADEGSAPASRAESSNNGTSAVLPQPKTLVPVASARGVTSSDAPARTAEPIQVPKIDIAPVVPMSPSLKANQLFARYLGAGNRWTKEKDGNKFTVQLLVLSSDEAADHIKDMIARDEYQEHSGKLHILRRNTFPPTLFVCYGEYSSMDEARNARNTMPLFLRKHHPYALSISDVLAKARD